jgi:hypothetical protein
MSYIHRLPSLYLNLWGIKDALYILIVHIYHCTLLWGANNRFRWDDACSIMGNNNGSWEAAVKATKGWRRCWDQCCVLISYGVQGKQQKDPSVLLTWWVYTLHFASKLWKLCVVPFQVDYRKQLIQNASSTINMNQLDIWVQSEGWQSCII